MSKRTRYTVGMILYTRWRIEPVFGINQPVTIIEIRQDRGCAPRYKCLDLAGDKAGWVNEDDLQTAI